MSRIDLMRLSRSTALSLVVLAIMASPATAESGWLDAGFGSEGRASMSGGGEAVRATPLPDGGFLVAGAQHSAIQHISGAYMHSTFAGVARFRSDGSLDTLFGDGGTKLLGGLEVTDITVAGDGRIYVALRKGGTGPDRRALIVRLTENGAIDSSFGTRGWLDATKLDPGFDPESVEVVDSGKLLVSGDVHSRTLDGLQVVVARLDEQGELDQGFGAQGIVRLTRSQGLSTGGRIWPRPDGSFLLTGLTYSSPGLPCTAVVALAADGSRISSFGRDGAITRKCGGGGPHYYIDSVAVRPDGGFIVAESEYWIATGPSRGGEFHELHVFDSSGRESGTLLPREGFSAIAPRTGGGYIASNGSGLGWSGYWMYQLLDELGNRVGGPLGAHVIKYGRVAGVLTSPSGAVTLAGTVCDSDCRFGAMRFIPPGLGQRGLDVWFNAPNADIRSSVKRTSLSGEAVPAARVARVEVAILKDGTRKGRCRWVRPDFKKISINRPTNRICANPKWIPASGTGSWTLKSNHRLPAGDYEAYVRVVTTAGTTTPFGWHYGATRKFKVHALRKRK